MDIFDFLTMLGGLSLFLFGMNIMGQALERRAGSNLRSLLGKLTSNRIIGLLTGLGITAVIQSSSATTVMVVGFVNSGLMTLKQAINVIMGANIGTTVTAWLLSLTGIDSTNFFVQMLKPSSFTPILAVIGVIYYMFSKNTKKNDTGLILLGFATLMFGMETMSVAVSGLADVEAFRNLFIAFQNPILGMLAGAILTGIIQSSSASVGILQALAVTGQVSYGAAIPIIMGQNIGTCVTALLSSVGTNKNAKRAALVHLSFNVIGTIVWLSVFCIIKVLFNPVLLSQPASLVGIAVAHSAFNILCTMLMLPLSSFLEKLVIFLVPDSKDAEDDRLVELDERLLTTPPIALKRCREVAADMFTCSAKALKNSLKSLDKYSSKLAENIREKEERVDYYKDILSSYLVKLSTHQISEADSAEAAKLLKIISDFERISNLAVNLLESAEELKNKDLHLSKSAENEMNLLIQAIEEILNLTQTAFMKNDLDAAEMVEPLMQAIDTLKEELRTRHIQRLQREECSIEAGFVWTDVLTNLERISRHCSSIARNVIDISLEDINLHEYLRNMRNNNETFKENYLLYLNKYSPESVETQTA
ncbi:Na/Pi cotransporter family protein [Traorella massiliensis]|uniref:Na/Pi cotransporter family protein n=1 Tax=Traorella massiliensis TaxID=1903263 RepID=UPI002352C153|nr:Na/Pi cotransporter family protein [Traorella massiliensis]